MCDLWQHTIEEDTPRGAIPAQIAAARDTLRQQSEVIALLKLYNAGSFFDPRAVPEADYDEVAALLKNVPRVVVESHPALIGSRVDRFLDSLSRQAQPEGTVHLEVAMGLETVHPRALDRMNKRMTLETFAEAAGQLRRRGASLRVFLLISPPFVPPEEQDSWLLRSIEAAFSCGASVVSLIPTRPGNGALEALASDEAFRVPRLEDIDRSLELALQTGRDGGRLFVDLWDLQRFADCQRCFEARRARLDAMNLEQRVRPRPRCTACGFGFSG